MEKATVRRSIAIPRKLMDEAMQVAPIGLKENWNSLVKEALRDYVLHRKAEEFEKAMEAMARDPGITAASSDIEVEFTQTEMDGL